MINLFLICVMTFNNYTFQQFFSPVLKDPNLQLVNFEEDQKRPTKSYFKFDPEDIKQWKKKAEQQKKKNLPQHMEFPHQWSPRKFQYKKNHKKYRTFNLDYHDDKIV